MTNKNFPEYHSHLRGLLGKLGKELPGQMSSFTQLHKQAMSEGKLTVKVKELIALAIAIAARCDGCIAFHTHDALKSGASREEIVETIGVAVLMGGGPSAMYGAEALAAVDQFQAAGTT